MGKAEDAKKQAAAEASRRWRAKHREKAREVGRNAYHRQQAKLGKASKPREPLTPERKREQARIRVKEWRKKNPERARAQTKRTYEKHRDTIVAKSAEWQRKNKERQRATYLKRTYGLTPEAYDALGTQCAICGATQGSKTRVNGDGKAYRLFVDHDHGTGKVRGLLCFGCNVAIGYLDHSVERLQAAMDYLRRTA